MKDVNPCLFCGSSNIKHTFLSTQENTQVFFCTDCNARGPEAQSLKSALYQWNSPVVICEINAIFRGLIEKMSRMVTDWNWKHRTLYVQTQVFEILAKLLDIPLDELQEWLHEQPHQTAQPFLEKWLNENTQIHQSLGTEAIREESRRVLLEVSGGESPAADETDGANGSWLGV